MDQTTVELLKSAILVGATLAGSLLTGTFLVLNTNRSLQTQNKQQIEKWEREHEAEKHEKLQNWFHEYVITKCVDPLLSEILAAQDFLIRSVVQRTGEAKSNGELPAALNDACVRFFTLTGATRLSLLFSAIRVSSHTFNSDDVLKYQACTQDVLIFLIRAKQYLLDMEISKKSDIYPICIIKHFESLGNAVDRSISKLLAENSDHNAVPVLTRMLRDFARSPKAYVKPKNP